MVATHAINISTSVTELNSNDTNWFVNTTAFMFLMVTKIIYLLSNYFRFFINRSQELHFLVVINWLTVKTSFQYYLQALQHLLSFSFSGIYLIIHLALQKKLIM